MKIKLITSLLLKIFRQSIKIMSLQDELDEVKESLEMHKKLIMEERKQREPKQAK